MAQRISDFEHPSEVDHLKTTKGPRRETNNINDPHPLPGQIQKKKMSNKIKTHVETIATDKGYRLVKKTAQKTHEGFIHEEYLGFR